MTLILSIILLIVLYLLAALFCCIETAFTSVNTSYLRDKASQGNKNAILAKQLLENSGSFFGTVLLGTNLLHVSITTLVGCVITVAILKTQWAQQLGLTSSAGSLVTSLIVTPTLLVFSEMVPKAIGRKHADKLTPALAPVLNFFKLLLDIPVIAIDFFSQKLSRLLGAKENHQLGQVTRDDLKILADVATEQGVIRQEAGKMMTSVLELDKKPIDSIMVPLVEVKSLPANATIQDLYTLSNETGFTRFPVYDRRIDDVIGLVSLRNCLYDIAIAPDRGDHLDTMPIAPYIERNVTFVPETMTAVALLNEFKKSRLPMMVVVDEYGGVVGVVTIEDLISLLMGGVQDLRNQETFRIQKLSDDVFECDGKTDIRTLEKCLGTKIENQDYETAAGLVLKLAGSIPMKNTAVQFQNYTIQVLEILKHRIVRLRFTRIQPDQTPPI